MEHQAEAQEDGTLRLLREEGESEVRSQKLESGPEKPQAKKKGPVTRFRLVVGISLVLAAVFGWWLYARQFEDTDDAEARCSPRGFAVRRWQRDPPRRSSPVRTPSQPRLAGLVTTSH